MTIVTMTSTVDELISGSTYRVRAKTAENLVVLNKATKTNSKRAVADKEGKRGG